MLLTMRKEQYNLEVELLSCQIKKSLDQTERQMVLLNTLRSNLKFTNTTNI